MQNCTLRRRCLKNNTRYFSTILSKKLQTHTQTHTHTIRCCHQGSFPLFCVVAWFSTCQHVWLLQRSRSSWSVGWNQNHSAWGRGWAPSCPPPGWSGTSGTDWWWPGTSGSWLEPGRKQGERCSSFLKRTQTSLFLQHVLLDWMWKEAWWRFVFHCRRNI